MRIGKLKEIEFIFFSDFSRKSTLSRKYITIAFLILTMVIGLLFNKELFLIHLAKL